MSQFKAMVAMGIVTHEMGHICNQLKIHTKTGMNIQFPAHMHQADSLESLRIELHKHVDSIIDTSIKVYMPRDDKTYADI